MWNQSFMVLLTGSFPPKGRESGDVHVGYFWIILYHFDPIMSMLLITFNFRSKLVNISIITGGWFGTLFFIFPYIGKNHPNRLIFFRGVAQPPTRLAEGDWVDISPLVHPPFGVNCCWWIRYRLGRRRIWTRALFCGERVSYQAGSKLRISHRLQEVSISTMES